MSAIDERIVSLKFDNRDFQSNIAATLSSLQKLESSLQLKGAAKGFDNIGKSASRFSLAGMASAVDGIASRFTTLGIIGVAALTNITNRAVDAGARLVKSLTIDPILDGYREYETKLNSVQTILANTGKEGKKGLAEVTKTLNRLNTYSDKTIYNFGEMAKNIGTFTAAGVGLKDSELAIKGIANLAALSGSNANQASTAMYQLSQSLASGKVNLQDWNSVVNAGMGGKVFQDAIKDTARVHGIAIDDIIKKEGGFRQAISTGFLSSDILLESLQKFTGDLSDKQLKAIGYSDQQIKAIQKIAVTAGDAATKVKTASQLIGTLQEAVGSGWAQSFEILFGNFDEAKKLFTDINNVVGGMINTQSKARNALLSEFKALGGRKAVIDGLTNAFHALVSVVTPIKEAFREIFPRITAQQLFDAATAFKNFTKDLKIGADTANLLKRTFAGVFAIFDIGRQFVSGLFDGVKVLFHAISGGSGSFLEITASIGDFIVGLRNSLKEGKTFSEFFVGLAQSIAVPIKAVIDFVGRLADRFRSINFGDAGAAIGKIADGLASLSKSSGDAGSKLGKLKEVFQTISDGLSRFAQAITQKGATIGKAIYAAFGTESFQGLIETLKTGVFAALVVAVRGFLGDLISAVQKGQTPGGIFAKVKESFDTLTGALKSMQSTLKAATLLQIAAAVGILTLSMVSLSKIDSAGLARASGAIAVMLAQLFTGLVLFQKFGTGGFIQMQAATTGLIALAIAIRILASSLKAISGLNWEEIAKGLVGTAGLLVSLALFTKFAAASKGGIISSAGLILLGAAIKILASAVKDFGELSVSEITKGLTAVTLILAALAGFSRTVGNPITLITAGAAMVRVAAGMKIMASAAKDFAELSVGELAKGLVGISVSIAAVALALGLLPRGAPISAVGIIITASALKILADAVLKFGNFNLQQMAKGLATMAASLGAVGIALALIPPTSVFSATAIAVVAESMVILGSALQVFAGFSVEEIAKSLITLGGALAIIAAGLIVMSGTLAGSAALVAAAIAIKLIAPALAMLAQLSIGQIAVGLAALAGTFIIIGAAGLLLGPLVPIIFALSGAIATLGAGMLLLGAGAFLLGGGIALAAAGLVALSAAVAGSAAGMVAVVKMLLDLLPGAGVKVGEFIIGFTATIQKGAPAILKAFTTIIKGLLQVVIDVAPKIGEAITVLIKTILNVITTNVPAIAAAGVKMILALLNGLKTNIPKVVPLALEVIASFLTAIASRLGAVISAAAKVIVAFLQGLAKELPKITDQAVKTIIAFVDGISSAIDANSAALGAAAGRLGVAIVKGIVKGIAGGIGEVSAAAKNLASSALNAAKGALGIHSPSKEFEKLGKFSVEGFVNGLKGDRDSVKQAFSDIVALTKDAMQSSKADVEALEERLKRLTHARHKDKDAIKETKAEIAQARLEYGHAGATLDFLTNKSKNHRAELVSLAAQYDRVSAKLDAANEKQKEAIRLRDDYSKGIQSSLSVLPDFTNNDMSLEGFQQGITTEIADIGLYQKTLEELRKLGLNDTLYKELVAKGPAAMKFATDLLAAGKEQVKVFNALSDSLTATAKSLADKAARELYQGGVDAATGLVNGFKSQKDKLEGEIGDLIDSIVKTVKKKLKIKSPSRVFAEIGEYSVAGLTQGIDSSSDQVVRSGENLGKAAILGLSKTISGLADLVSDEINVNPTITPVLDLSGVRSSASNIEAMLAGQAVTIDAAYSSATDASRGYDANQTAAADIQPPTPGPTLEFNQYNSSPKALSEAEIYRNTNNQLSKAKGALGNV